MNWWQGLKSKISFNEPLARHTAFKSGGPAKFFVEPKDRQDLIAVLRRLKKHKIPFLVIGNGSNILINDKGLNLAVLRLSTPYFRKISLKAGILEAGAGAMLNRIVEFNKAHGLSSTEFLAGIPGTVGGALVMNAGAWGGAIGDLVDSVKVVGRGLNVKVLKKAEIKFGYRESDLEKYIILSARLKLKKGSRKEIAAAIRDYRESRVKSQDLSRPSLGCAFRNPPGYSAGKLIDLCGLKGRRSGGACISRKHANFILNFKNAAAGDYLKLMHLAAEKVKNKFNIVLEPEIKIWK